MTIKPFCLFIVRPFFIYETITGMFNQLVGVLVKDIAIGTEGFGFDFRAGQLIRSVVNAAIFL